MEHVAGLEDYAVAQAAYDRACTRWPKEVVTLRQGARVVEDSRRRCSLSLSRHIRYQPRTAGCSAPSTAPAPACWRYRKTARGEPTRSAPAGYSKKKLVWPQ